MTYLAVKAVHFIGAICWFAGLFYGVRLFVYHAETDASDSGEVMRKQFDLMSRRLWLGIAWPSMVVTLVFGFWLMVMHNQFGAGWLHLKLGLLVLLIGYHFLCDSIRRSQRDRHSRWSGQQLRVLNEVPTVLLVGIVVAAVFKTLLTARVLGITLGILLAVLLLGLWGYRRARMKS